MENILDPRCFDGHFETTLCNIPIKNIHNSSGSHSTLNRQQYPYMPILENYTFKNRHRTEWNTSSNAEPIKTNTNQNKLVNGTQSVSWS